MSNCRTKRVKRSTPELTDADNEVLEAADMDLLDLEKRSDEKLMMDEISDFEIVEHTNLKKRDKMFFYTCAMNCMKGHEERTKIEGEKLMLAFVG